MFYVAIVLYMLVDGMAPSYWAPDGLAWWHPIVTALFLHGFLPQTINSVVPGGWSIAVEMTFYAILPFVLGWVRGLTTACLLFMASLPIYLLSKWLVPQLFAVATGRQYLVDNFIFFNFLSQAPIFCLGIVLYQVIAAQMSRTTVAAVGGPLFILLSIGFVHPFRPLSIVPHHILAGAVFATFIWLLSKFPTCLFVNRLTVWLGMWSFSIYLLQFVILDALQIAGVSALFPRSDMGSLFHYLVTVALVAAVSHLTYRHIEKPGIRLGARFIATMERVRVARCANALAAQRAEGHSSESSK